ncbi:uncharacterized protein HaLaN_32304, partial [Haematococcus lacustris]
RLDSCPQHPAIGMCCLQADGHMSAATFAKAAIIPGVLFVLSHMLTTQRSPDKVLRDARFLVICTFLAVSCTTTYFLTGGSYWAAVYMHFALVYPYVALLGGWKTTHTPTPMRKRAVGIDLSPAPVEDVRKLPLHSAEELSRVCAKVSMQGDYVQVQAVCGMRSSMPLKT